MIVFDTLAHRWYAFGFVALLLLSVRAEGGWPRALRFWAIAAVVQAAAELSSTRNGFPFGHYTYVATADEAYLWNVPLFVPVSFGVVVWAGRAIAARLGLRGLSLVAGGAIGAAVLDLAIDPMTLRGGEWFLGRLYEFDASGPFGVPLSNFGGWVLTSAVILLVDHLLSDPQPAPSRGVRPLMLPLVILGFFTLVALLTGNVAIFALNAAMLAACTGLALSASPQRVPDARP